MNVSRNGSGRSELRSHELADRAHRGSQRLFFVTVALAFFVAGIGIGFFAADGNNSDPYATLTYEDAQELLDDDLLSGEAQSKVSFDQFWEVWTLIKRKYVNQPVSDEDLLYGAIAGMVGGLDDPYSLFFEPTDATEFIQEINGSFQGIGAEVGIKNDVFTIIAPLAGSPAESEGLLAGDRVLFIDGLETARMSLDTAVNKIRGEAGTTVVLGVDRDGEDGLLEFTVTRGTIQIDSVKTETRTVGDKQIVLVELSAFNRDTPADFEKVVEEILLQQPDGIILDLRNNAGGFLDAAVDITSHFLSPDDVVLYEENSSGEVKVYQARSATQLSGIPLVVLINAGSASASEIMAGALQDLELAVLIGTTSFGKGTVQELQPLDDGSSLKLTVGLWLTPLKHKINGTGIYPDYYAERTAEDYSADRDPQLEMAERYFADPVGFVETEERYVPEEIPTEE